MPISVFSLGLMLLLSHVRDSPASATSPRSSQPLGSVQGLKAALRAGDEGEDRCVWEALTSHTPLSDGAADEQRTTKHGSNVQ